MRLDIVVYFIVYFVLIILKLLVKMYNIYYCFLQRNVDKSDKYANVMKLKTTQLNIYCTSLASRNI